MVQIIMEDMDDEEFLRQHIHTLDREFDFWMTNHTVEIDHEGHRSVMVIKLSREGGGEDNECLILKDRKVCCFINVFVFFSIFVG